MDDAAARAAGLIPVPATRSPLGDLLVEPVAEPVAEPVVDADPTGDPASARRRRRPPARYVALAVAVLLLAGLAATAGIFAASARGYADRTTAANTAMAAARAEAVNLTTIGYTTATADLDRIIAGSTGALRTQFIQQRAAFPTVLAQTKSVSRGTVLSSALMSLHGSTAQVAVAADATVSAGAGADAGQSVVKHYRMVMRLVLLQGHWLVSDVAFAGLPQ